MNRQTHDKVYHWKVKTHKREQVLVKHLQGCFWTKWTGLVGGPIQFSIYRKSDKFKQRWIWPLYTKTRGHVWLPWQPPTCDGAHGIESSKGRIDVLLLAPLHHALEHAHQTLQSLVIMMTTIEGKQKNKIKKTPAKDLLYDTKDNEKVTDNREKEQGRSFRHGKVREL